MGGENTLSDSRKESALKAIPEYTPWFISDTSLALSNAINSFAFSVLVF